MNIHEAYTIYNNSLGSMDPVLAEAIDRMIDNKAMEIHRLREALKLYAANENYERVANDPDIYVGGYSQPTWEPSWIEFDNGETARKALEGDKQ